MRHVSLDPATRMISAADYLTMEVLSMQSRSSHITAFQQFLLSRFKGRAQFKDIKNAVMGNFPTICDNSQLCTHEYPYRPEWEHKVRHALDNLKNKKKLITQETRGEYIFP